MTDTSTAQGMNPALKIILIVGSILLVLACAGVALVGWFFSASVGAVHSAVLRAETEAIVEVTVQELVAQHGSDGTVPDAIELTEGHQDAWGNALQVRIDPAASSFEVISLGADGVPGGEGDNADIIRRGTFETATLRDGR